MVRDSLSTDGYCRRLTLLTLLVASFFSLTSGCGWQLRGTAPLAPIFERVYLEAAQTPEVGRLLKQQLAFRGSQMVTQAADASLLLQVTSLKQTQRTLSLTSGGLIKDLELRSQLEVRLTVPDTDTAQVITVASRRILENDDNQVVATQRDIEITRSDMQNELVSQLMRRLESFSVATTATQLLDKQ